ncbi:MAG: ankyrin repeat domain-containing protein [Candidatus Krumholzibacteria bacterium]|nr:ankyrin repeat domain-containing protein [Candidatus Krumholzibacteria bacterium]
MLRRLSLLTLAACMILGAEPALGGDIHRAIEAGDAARVREIVKSNPASLTERDNNQFRELPIHFAATTGNVEIARILLDAGAEIDAGDSDNSTALGIAAMRGHAPLVTLLIERGANVNHRDRKADCPLSFAVGAGKEEIAKQLVDAGADLYFRSPEGATLIHKACERKMPVFAAYLLDHGADIETIDGHDMTPLAYAAMSGSIDIVRLLLDRGAKTDPGGKDVTSPLMYTTWRNHVECARLLLEKGAKVDATGFHGRTGLFNAARTSSVEMIELLVKYGANVNHRSDDGETALILAAENGYADRVAALLAEKADPDLGTDSSGRTALQLAAIRGYNDIARQLLDAGAGVDGAGGYGETPLQLARYYGNDEVAVVLEQRGASSGGAGSIDRSPAAFDKIGDREAAIWFLGHSGWAVKTKNHLLIFDYWPQGEDCTKPGLCNGRINPAELSGEKVAVFASHFHQDHYVPAIFGWKDQVRDITYFLGLRPRDAVPPYEYMEGRIEKKYGDIKLTTIPATDAGVGMVIEVDGLTIFHAGDHTNGKDGMMTEFSDEIDYLRDKGIKPDICFMGILGCSLGNPAQVKDGIIYTLETLKPKAFIPMHAQAREKDYREFVDGIKGRFESVQMVVPGNCGDHFVYSKGKITDPKESIRSQVTAGSKAATCKDKKTGCSGS